MSIRDRVQVGMGDEGWAIQGTDCGSPVGKAERRDPSRIPLFSFYGASRWYEDVS